MTLHHVLSQTGTIQISLENYNADTLKKAARFWVGPDAYKFRKADCIAALHKVFSSQTTTRDIVSALPKKQQQVVSIFARYGPVVFGEVLAAELNSRGLIEKDPDERRRYYYRPDNLVQPLRDSLVLIGNRSSSYSYFSSRDRRYPTMILHPALADSVPPIAPLPWKPSKACPGGKSDAWRSSAEVALDLWQVAMELGYLGNWKTVKGGALSKGSQNRLKKSVPLASAEHEPLSPPDPESLYYEVLRAMGVVSPQDDPYEVRDDRLDQYLRQPAEMQGWNWVRAWIEMQLWQDGIGVVPDRDNPHEPVRIEPPSLRKARILLVWALCRVAHGATAWLDLETFLKDLWQAIQEDDVTFYWGRYTWDPDFDMARRKYDLPVGNERSLGFWLDGVGSWASNAIMVTLVTLGLVERGQSTDKTSRPCFRLTALGQAVFGAPELEMAPQHQAVQFLTVQPNLDVLAYLDQADARQICTLAQFAVRTSIAGGQVQTFALQRESVYDALESGMTLEAIEAFLTQHSKTELPDNVRRMLFEWAGKRDALVLRTHVTLACGADAKLAKTGRSLGNGMVLLPKVSPTRAAKDYAGWSVIDHQGRVARAWTAEELGTLHPRKTDSISQTRLAYLAAPIKGKWQMTEKSVANARQLGLTADQMIAWLHDHLSNDLPAVLEMAIRNWTGRASAFTGNVQLLQITRPQARDAILQSTVFKPLLDGHIPPDWFIVRHDKAAELKRLLTQLGFSLNDAYRLASTDAPPKTRKGRKA